MIRRHLLDNPHRTTVTLTPDAEQAAREAAAEKTRLEAVEKTLSPERRAELAEETRTLKLRQETPDAPEALAAIPSLGLGDLPRENKTVPIDIGTLADTSALAHDLDTSGIIYLDVAFDLHALPPELLPYLALFSRALLETGAGADDFITLSQRIGRDTGGISAQRFASSTLGGDGTAAAWFILRGKATPEHASDLLAILREVLTVPHLHDRDRIRQIVIEEKARFEGRLAPMGLRLVDLRLRASLSEAGWAAEQMGGVSYLFFLRRLADQIESDWPAVQSALESIRDTLVDRAAMVVNLTADAASRRQAEPELERFLGHMPRSSRPRVVWDGVMDERSEGLTFTAPVNFVGKGADLVRAGYTPSGASAAAVKHLNAAYLWDNVRVKGGAYGGSSRFDRFSGAFSFLSYRDPNLLATLDVYDGASAFLRQEIGATELTRSVIGAIGEVDRYMLPDAKGLASLQRHLLGDTDAARQKMRDELLSAGPRDFGALADALAEVAATARVVVLGSEGAITAANAERQSFLHVTKVL